MEVKLDDHPVVVIDDIEDTIAYITPDGDYHLITPDEYQRIRDKAVTFYIEKAIA